MNSILSKTIALAALAFLFGCGGGSDGGGIGGTGVVSTGVMAKGSVIVNGVRFEDTGADILIDDTPRTAASLQDGMVVSVRGDIDGSGSNGTAQQVVAQSEVRGLVTAVDATANPQTFVVLGQSVIIDDQTLLNGASIGAALVDTLVEVHGLRDSLGNIRATRVEATPGLMGSSLVDEIRGVVTGRANATDNLFNVGSQAVNAAGATIVGGSFGDGDVVEVHCTVRPNCVNGGVFQASLIEVEGGGNLPGPGQRFEVEGLVSGYTLSGDSDFFVAGVRVTTSGSTRFEGGLSTDMANNVKVEAEGVWNGTSLVASKIEFKRSVVRLQGFVTASGANSFTLRIGTLAAARSVQVERDTFTDVEGGSLPSASDTTCVQVRGQRKAGIGIGIVVTAGEIRNSCSHSDDHVLQAPLEAKATPNLTLLGLPAINVIGAQFRDLNDAPVSLEVFFSRIFATVTGQRPVAGTLVRVRFESTNLATVSEVEIED